MSNHNRTHNGTGAFFSSLHYHECVIRYICERNINRLRPIEKANISLAPFQSCSARLRLIFLLDQACAAIGFASVHR